MLVTAFAVLLAGLLPQADQIEERAFNLAQAHAAQSAQEIANVVRVVAGIRQVSLTDDHKSMTVRGTADQVRLAEWLVAALDRPSIVPQERGVAGTDDKVRVFHVKHAQTPRDLQEIVTLIRALADAQHVNFNTQLNALVLRGNAWRISLAEWLIHELDQPADAPAPAGPSEYRLPGGSDILPPGDVFVRIFYTRARTPEELQSKLAGMRSSVKMLPRSFINTARKAIIVRASADKMASAEQALMASK